MVSVRNIHTNKSCEFNLQEWIAYLSISNQSSSELLVQTWNYCLRTTQGIPNTEWLLWKGIEMVEILSELRMDIDVLRASLMLPLIDAQIVTKEMLYKIFNKEVITLIYNTIDISNICSLREILISPFSSKQIDDTYRMPLGIVDDFRYILIKLAERIVFLRGIKNDRENERIIAAKECANVYVPLANRLGIEQLKWELEDYCFRYLYPSEYKHISKLLHERRIDREYYIHRFVSSLKKSMQEKGVKLEIYGRPKHIYSIWRKMQRKHLTFNELFDIHAVRIISEQLKYCYSALKIVHTLFHYLPNEFDDYIAHPKPNGYQSIHTVVIGPNDKTVEIQIRTKQMHKNAELGLAAHWKYKEGSINHMCLGHEKYIAYLNKIR